MAWKPIVAGVDQSPEGSRAAVLAAGVARAARTRCYLVHAVGDPWLGPVMAGLPIDVGKLNRQVVDAARAVLRSTLRGRIPQATLERLDIRTGHAALALRRAVREHGAELLVVGGKQHTVGRWLAPSTVHHLVRTVDVPLLVTGPPKAGGIRRVLAAVDLSSAARLTLDAAARFAHLFDARLRVLHAVEPLPRLAPSPLGIDQDEVASRTAEVLERSVWSRVGSPGVERLVRRGPAADVIVEAAGEWPADLVVVGSHGKHWAERLIIGSTTERLLTALPAAVLVVPVPQPAGRKNPPRSRHGRKLRVRRSARRP
jgi:nucleotide-binding universal stress UspA family protein